MLRGLGLWSATGVVVGSIIGQSVFLVGSDIAREVGTEFRTFLVLTIGGGLALLGSFCYAELGAALPESGGDYVYLGRGLHPLAGYMFGWTSSMIMRPGSAAVIAAGMVRLSGFLLPSVANPIVDLRGHLPVVASAYHLTLTAGQLLAGALVIAVTILNYFGVASVGRFQLIVSSFKVGALAVLVTAGVILVHGTAPPPAIRIAPDGTIVHILNALVPVMLAYNGFQFLEISAERSSTPGEICLARRYWER